MSGATSGYLPPVIVNIIAQDASFARAIQRDIALLKAFGKEDTNPNVGLNDKVFLSDLAGAKAELLNFAKQVYDARLGADAAPLVAEIARMRAELRTLSPFDIKIDANIAAAEAKIALLREQLAGLKTDALIGSMLGGMTGSEPLAMNRRVTSMWPVPVGSASGGKSGLPGWLGGLLGAKAGLDSNGNPLGLAAALGFGGGKTLLGALPTMGSLGSLFGLGAEHLGAAGLGVGLSGLEAGLGGGLLGLGSMGVMGVGMGTNMAGMGQASNDIKLVVQAQNQLNTAMQNYQYLARRYGSASAAATAALQSVRSAQANLNTTLGSFSPIARGAVLAAANTARGFEKMFDQVTGLAEKRGAQIIRQAMLVGEKFLPIIGQYAARNMAIISKSLNQPFNAKTGAGGLFGWLKSGTKYGGLGIFKDLESIFTKNLPTGMKALTQGIELFAKVVRDSAQYVGPFIHAIARLLTRLNSPGHAAALAHTIGKLIGIFRVWMRFILSIIRVLWNLGKATAGVGTGIIGVFTHILNTVAKFLGALSNHKAVHGFFSAHYAQMVKGFGGVLEGVVPVVLSFAKAMMQIMTVTTRLTAGVLAPIGRLFKLVFGGTGRSGHGNLVATITGWIGAFFVLRAAVGKVLPQLMLLPTRVGLAWLKIKAFPGQVVGKVQALWAGLKAFPSNAVAFVKSMAAGFMNMARTIASGLLSGLKSVGAGLRSVFTASTEAAAGEDTAAASTGLLDAALGVLSMVGIVAVAVAIFELYKHLGFLRTAMIVGAAGVGMLTVAFIALDTVPVVAIIVGIIAAVVGLVAGIIYLVKHWKQVWGEVKKIAAAVWAWIRHAWALFLAGLKYDADHALGLLKSAWRSVWDWIKGLARSAWAWLKARAIGLWHDLVHAWDNISRDTNRIWGDVVKFIKSIPGRVIHGLARLGSDLLHLAEAAWHLFERGVKTVAGDVISWLRGLPGRLLHSLGNLGHLLWNAGLSIIHGLWGGLKSAWHHVSGWFSGLGGWIARHKGPISADAVLLTPHGNVIMQGLGKGLVTGRGAHVLPALRNTATTILDAFKPIAPQLQSIGVQLMQGLAVGIRAGTGAAVAAAVASAHAVAAATKAASQTHSPSLLYMAIARDWMLGLVAGIGDGLPMVQGAMRGAVGAVTPATRLAGAGGAAGAGGGMVNAPISVQIHVTAPSGNAPDIARVVGPAVEREMAKVVARLKAGNAYR